MKTIDYRFHADHIYDEAEQVVFEQIPDEVLHNIKFFNKKAIPNLQMLKNMIMTARDYFDVIIIDHINYIHYEGENETKMI